MDKILKNHSKCRIVVDAMGGDFAPHNAVLGSLDAFNETDIDLFLIGDREQILEVINTNNKNFDPTKIIHTTEIISMSEHPTEAFKKKKDSSIVKGASLIKDKKADALVSAGNTGAMSVASILGIGRIQGISRPTLTAPLPNEKDSYTFLSDVGAFVDSKPQHLLDYAHLSKVYIEEVVGIKNPKVGLLNIGEEKDKGKTLTFETSKLMENSNLNYVGNVEGKDILKGSVDLVICDGFIGNIILKFTESIIPFLKSSFKNYSEKGFINKLKIAPLKLPSFKSAFKESLDKANPDKVGGLPLLGVDGISIIGHGSSSVLAIKNMVLQANKMHQNNLIQKMKDSISKLSNIN
ncbi:MAG: phosphate acyltransferase PlsX [Ignavibacteriales bacterium CG12_big_fil_rev_8_21_14_0_65_30_8]|nr:MAG: phosphate acyltransferase PlsX [Ignavibacteriales bacterium CG12_big_fil_rev_8_21_14_0_65_30_8]